MGKNIMQWKTKGMNRDTSVSAFNAEFAFENVNMRLATNEGNTMMSWVNERGTEEIRITGITEAWETTDAETSSKYHAPAKKQAIQGITIGTAVLNHQLVLFTTMTTDDNTVSDGVLPDRIYVFKYNDDSKTSVSGKLLYEGNLNFHVKYPIETLVSYEAENIQKIYWTDNRNQPRLVNIIETTQQGNDNQFDFIPELKLRETVSIVKQYGAGEFAPGVIQYAFTYYRKNGQESNIFYTTPLQYITYADRGGAPDGKIANCFKITIKYIDKNFNYLRIYSIQRTSLDATPIAKRVADLEILEDAANLTFVDSGTEGDIIDPTELLYKGGEDTVVKTMEQKDNTLFLGNITLSRPTLHDLKDTVKEKLAEDFTRENPVSNDCISFSQKQRHYNVASTSPFVYVNTLDSSLENYEGAACFKYGEYYRLGVQFQYKNGKWSEPFWIGDKQCYDGKTWGPSLSFTTKYDSEGNIIERTGTIKAPEFTYTKTSDVWQILYKKGYRKARPVFVKPDANDRTILCQGIGNPTLYRPVDRDTGLYGVASWLFRVNYNVLDHNIKDWIIKKKVEENEDYTSGGIITNYPDAKLVSHYDLPILFEGNEYTADGNTLIYSPYLYSTEIMGSFDAQHSYYVDRNFATINSPDIEFNDYISSVDFKGYKVWRVGKIKFDATYGDIDIQTSVPPAGTNAAGFVHKTIKTEGYGALVSGLFYEDHLVDDTNDTPDYGEFRGDCHPVKFPVFMWHRNGSLNNDCNRAQYTARLSKKKISNYRLSSSTSYNPDLVSQLHTDDIQLFSSDELTIVKVNGHVYQGNIDTMLTPTSYAPFYMAGAPWQEASDNTNTYICNFRTNPDSGQGNIQDFRYASVSALYTKWMWAETKGTEIGDYVSALRLWKDSVSIKYKSTPHLVVSLSETQESKEYIDNYNNSEGCLAMVEVRRDYNKDIIFGGTSDEALQAATWIPCGPPVNIYSTSEKLTLSFKWGDSYFQRYECLKTYPYTKEDNNQVVEIASFMVETRTNIDGRYDRNRGQISNLNMTPQNFNLINPVYSQMDDFFSYKILNDDAYKISTYPNTVSWTKTKQNGADIDLWTNITLASTLEVDGDKGAVTKLTRLNSQLLAFQDRGISQILYNENTQISSTEGVPIELANSGKVQGKRYLSDTIGCSNKWSIAQTPMGIYFMDSNDKGIYLFNGQLSNLSTSGGFNSWAKQTIPSAENEWDPHDFGAFVTYYDKLNQDVLFINSERALAYSEKLGGFTSFYDYGKVPYFENFDDTGVWVQSIDNQSKLWKHQAGDYCKFFGNNKPYSMTLIANQNPQTDKIFTNLELRACVADRDYSWDNIEKKFPEGYQVKLPFDKLDVWNDYQHGILNLTKDRKFTHATADKISSLTRKFRIWRCDLPRDNAPVDAAEDATLGTIRYKPKPLDRIRNMWAYIKLEKKAASFGDSLPKTEIHDITATYFS